MTKEERRELVEKLVDTVNNTDTIYDAIDEVEELLSYYNISWIKEPIHDMELENSK